METATPSEQSQASVPRPSTQVGTIRISNDFEQLKLHILAKRQKGKLMKKHEDLDPTDRQLTLDANRLLLPLFIVSTAPSSEAKEPSLQAGDTPDDPYRFEKALQQRAKAFLKAQDWESLTCLYKIAFPSPVPENSRLDGESQQDYLKRVTRTAPYSRFSADLKRQLLSYIGLWDVYVGDSE